MTFSNSYMVTNRAETGAPELFGDTPQPAGAFSYATATGAHVSDGGSFAAASTADFYAALNADLTTVSPPQLTVFIHGLDTDWNKAVSYTALIGGNLNGASAGYAASYGGLVIGFSWPSTTSIVDYLIDRASIRATGAAFVGLVRDLQANLPAGTPVSLVCHSEGNYMMKVAADALSAAGITGCFDRILLVAADLPEDAFASGGYAASIPGAAAQVTVYHSLFDTTMAEADAIMAALDVLGEDVNRDLFPDDYTNWLPTWQRLGTFGAADLAATPADLYDVDCLLVDNPLQVPSGYSTHTAYFVIAEIVADLGQVLSGVAPASVANRVPVPGSDGRGFWMWPARTASEPVSGGAPARFRGLLARAGAARAATEAARAAAGAGPPAAAACARRHAIDLPRSGLVTRVRPAEFSLTTTGARQAAYPVGVALSFDATRQALVVDFDSAGDPHVADNNYTTDNSEMWNQEVFEMFISAGPEVPTRYVEIELNPNGALFSAWISNPNGRGTENQIDYFDGHAEGIVTAVARASHAWNGQISLPLALLGAQVPTYRVNFFRVVSMESHDPSAPWACTAATCRYLAWSPTYSGAKPAFHIPAYFGHLNLT